MHHDKLQKGKDASSRKNILFAIGLNFVYLGAGYFYMGRRVPGILLILIATGMGMAMASDPMMFLIVSGAWFGFFVITCLDMLILQSKIRKQNTKTCPYCVELVKKEAIFCLHCKKNFVAA